MVLDDIELVGEWLDVYTELGVTKDKTVFIQNKSLAAVYIWLNDAAPDTKTKGIYLKSGENITLNGAGSSILVVGRGTIHAYSN